MFCQNCGASISGGAEICSRCGVRVADQSGGPDALPKRIHTASLVLSIIGLVFSILLPIITYPCSIIALVMANKRRGTHKVTAAIVMSIIGLAVALVNSAIGAFMGVQGML